MKVEVRTRFVDRLPMTRGTENSLYSASSIRNRSYDKMFRGEGRRTRLRRWTVRSSCVRACVRVRACNVSLFTWCWASST